jgi:hypothetical protein
MPEEDRTGAIDDSHSEEILKVKFIREQRQIVFCVRWNLNQSDQRSRFFSDSMAVIIHQCRLVRALQHADWDWSH